MARKGLVPLLLSSLLMVALFQNCSGGSATFQSAASSSEPKSIDTTPAQSGSGQPYEGKIYVQLSGPCPDGTIVRSRIVLQSATAATLVRDKCENIVPQALSSSEFTIDSSDNLTFRSQTYVPEKPAITLSPLATWYYQLQGNLVQRSVQVYDIDMVDTPATTIQNLKNAGHVVICYISAGSHESHRPDANLFDPADIGQVLGGGSSDRWLDTRSPSVRSIMLSRLDLAKSKGCDGVDLDNVDAFSSFSGFPLDRVTQIDYNRFLARASHDRGLIVALNNVGDLAQDLVHDFDFVVAQECVAEGECHKYKPFTDMGKAVFNAEYTAYSAAQCSAASAASISLAYYNRALDGSVFNPCP